MSIDFEHRKALQQLVTEYWQGWVTSERKELPDWFYTVLDFMEVAGQVRFNVVTGRWEEA